METADENLDYSIVAPGISRGFGCIQSIISCIFIILRKHEKLSLKTPTYISRLYPESRGCIQFLSD